MQLTCPHCKSATDVGEATEDGLLCPACGASLHPDPTATATWSPPSGPRTLGQFELRQEVGRGSFGTVYRAWDSRLHRFVAIKVLRASRVASAGDVDRFMREARLAAQLHHPAIVPIHEVGQHEGVPYLVCDFIDGTTLAEFHTARRPTPRQAAEWTAAVADALQYAHERGVVHRDVKPSNIMLERTGGSTSSGGAISGVATGSGSAHPASTAGGGTGGSAASGGSADALPGSAGYTPRLMDFGLAKREAGDATMTTDGELLGTPAYMSPEQARGEAHRVDGRTDVYSLGVILYQLLTGELPFRGAPRMLLHQVLNDEPRVLRSLNDRVPRDLETICLKAMAKEPARRYATAGAFADDLRRFLRGDAILARPVGVSEKLLRWCRRNRAMAAVTALTAASLVAVAAVSAVLAWREHQHTHALTAALADSERERHRADERLAESYLDRGITLCEQGELARGLLWLVAGLEVAPADAADLQHALRANVTDWARRVPPLRGVFHYPEPVELQVLGPDARTLFVRSAAGRAELWDAVTARRIAELDHDPHEVTAAFSGDGRTLLTVRKADGVGKIWDTLTGRPVGAPLPAHGPVTAADVASGGKHLLTVGADGTVRVWAGALPGAPARFRPHQGPTTAALFSPDGQTVLTTSDGEARLWAVATGKPLGPAMKFPSLSMAAFSGDGRFVVTGSWTRTAQVWSVASGARVGPPLKHPKPVTVVALSPDGSVVLAGGDATARLWNVADGKAIGAPLAHRNNVICAAFHRDGRTVLTGALDATVRLWDAGTGKLIQPELPGGRAIAGGVFGLQGTSFAALTRDGTVRVWDLAEAAPAPVRLPLSGKLGAITFDRLAAVALTSVDRDSKGETRLWDVATGKPRGEALPHPAPVRAVAISADGALLATGGEDGLVRCWDAATSRPVGVPMRHSKEVRRVAFSADGKTVWSSGNDGTVQHGEPITGKARTAACKHDGTVHALAHSPDGRFLVTGGADSLVHVWSLPQQTAMASMRHQDWVIAAAVSPDGQCVLSGSDDNTARLWDATSGKPLGLPLVHQNAVAAVTFSPDGRTVGTGSEDNTARRWDRATGKPIGPPREHPDWVLAVALRGDGRSLVTGCADGGIRVWKLPAPAAGSTEQLRLWARELTGQELDPTGAVRLLDAAEWHTCRERLRSTDAGIAGHEITTARNPHR